MQDTTRSASCLLNPVNGQSAPVYPQVFAPYPQDKAYMLHREKKSKRKGERYKLITVLAEREMGPILTELEKHSYH